jgi:flagellar protein FlaJ
MEGYFSSLLSAASLFISPAIYSKFVISILFYLIIVEFFFLMISVQWLILLLPVLFLFQLLPLLALYIKILLRRRSTEAELPFLLMSLTVFSHESYPTLQDGFSKLASTGMSIFPALSREAAIIERNLTFIPGSPTEILERTFSSHPSGMMKEFVHSFLTTLMTGKDIVEFVKIESSRYVALLEDSWKTFSTSLASIAEFSFLLLALFPIGLQMTVSSLPTVNSSTLLLLSFLLLAAFTVLILILIDALQPSLHNQTAGSFFPFLTIASFLASSLLYTSNSISITSAAIIPMIISVIGITRTIGHYMRTRRGEDEIGLFIHDLAEESKIGVSLPEALSNTVSKFPSNSSIRDAVRTFYQAIRLGATSSQAQMYVLHPSWLVKVSFVILSIAFDTGAGFEQLERLSLFFKRVLDARRAASRSLLPFLIIGVAVPTISVSSLSFLSDLSQLGSSLFSSTSIQFSQRYVTFSILLVSFLTGLILSKLFTLSIRNMVAMPLLLLSTLISFLIFGIE